MNKNSDLRKQKKTLKKKKSQPLFNTTNKG